MKKHFIWTDGQPIRSPLVQRLFKQGLLKEKRRHKNGVFRWRAKCSHLKCDQTYDIYATKSKTCRKHTPGFVWPNGHRIIGRLAQMAFQQKRLVAYKIENSKTIWYVKCRKDGCLGTYRLDAETKRATVFYLCTKHARIEKNKVFSSFRRNAKMEKIKGVAVNHPEILALKEKLVWKSVNGEKRPHFRCENVECGALKEYRYFARRYIFRCHQCFSGKKIIRPFEALLNQLKSSVKKRNKTRKTAITISLTYNQFARICRTQKNCFYCGGEVVRRAHIKKWQVGKTTNSSNCAYLDRVNPALGYSAKNIVTCCGPCNMTKSTHVSAYEMLLLANLRNGKTHAASSMAKKFRRHFMEWGFKVRTAIVFGGRWSAARKRRLKK